MFDMSMFRAGRLIEVVENLPPDILLSSTGDFDQMGRRLGDVSIQEACDAVLAAGLADHDADFFNGSVGAYVDENGKQVYRELFVAE